MHVQSPVSARCETDAVVLGVPSAVHYFDLAEFLVPRPARARRRVRGVSRIGNASTPHVGTASQAAVWECGGAFEGRKGKLICSRRCKDRRSMRGYISEALREKQRRKYARRQAA